MEYYHGTTILLVRRGKEVVIGGDGQVSLGPTILKGNANKIRRLYKSSILAGFAGATADAFTLFELFEAKLEKNQGHLTRSSVELAKDWRTDKRLRRLEALIVVADKKDAFILTGVGDVIKKEDVIGVGSGGAYAQAAALALLKHTKLSPHDIVKQGLTIAADICVYTNHHHTIETLTSA